MAVLLAQTDEDDLDRLGLNKGDGSHFVTSSNTDDANRPRKLPSPLIQLTAPNLAVPWKKRDAEKIAIAAVCLAFPG